MPLRFESTVIRHNTERQIEAATEKSIHAIEGIDTGHSTQKAFYADEKVTVDLFVYVYYGYRIPEIAWLCQEAVKRTLEKNLELKVTAVNVYIQGITVTQQGFRRA